ncbi:Vacuolar cation/proton exchanger 1a [Dendrobium catenatum]|uniref:Vacuolar cation/proton exchanger 1a n=1 Tax=Dendrobium catenatum TaxID=906689 RepID=A0A2I0V7R5_9ASPA|nr:Vacuolar cation/proton exchanger 1a [Dendrobium catenatum]
MAEGAAGWWLTGWLRLQPAVGLGGAAEKGMGGDMGENRGGEATGLEKSLRREVREKSNGVEGLVCLERTNMNLQRVIACQNLRRDFKESSISQSVFCLVRNSIRRLKDHVLTQLPPKRRQIITLKLKTSDILLATTLCTVNCGFVDLDDPSNQLVIDCNDNDNGSGEKSRNFNTCHEKDYRRTSKLLSLQEIGIAKLSGFREWFSNHVVVGELGDANNLGIGLVSLKMIIFAHHLKVLDGVQDFLCEKGIQFVRIDGRTLPKDRHTAVESFRLSSEVKIAIIGITAGGVGLDFSSAQNVVFLELPKSASEMLQAEDRAHRRGQTNAVNIYIFCAKGTSDESHWMNLNKSLFRVSSMMNGKYDSVKEIEVDGVIQLGNAARIEEANCEANCTDSLNTEHQVESMGMHVCTPDVCKSFTAEKSNDREDNMLQALNLELKLNGAKDSDFGLPSILNESVEGNDAEPSHSYHSDKTGRLGRGSMEVDSVETMPYQMVQDEGRWLGITNADGDSYEVDAGGEILIQEESLRFEVDYFFPAMEPHYPHDNLKSSYPYDNLKASYPYGVLLVELSCEVSNYTGRIHLYLCVPGKDVRPRPIFVNFRQEELDSIVLSLGELKKEAASQLVKENPAYCNIFRTFIKEWSNLRPIERHKLLGKPLQLPLSLELCYLKETVNHGLNGLLKGGSKRRVTPLSEIGCHLPENAVWKKVVLYSGSAKEKEYTQAWSVSGEPLCKLCHAICNGKLSTAPEFFEDLFCNLCCFQEYRVRTSQKALREALFQIEHGVCTMCKLDCHKLVTNIRPLPIAARRNHVENIAPELAKKKKFVTVRLAQEGPVRSVLKGLAYVYTRPKLGSAQAYSLPLGAAADSWGISICFLSIILLPIVGNAAEHAGAIIFALKNKLDITLGVSLGSATQISMFVVPLSVMVAWVMGIQMDLDFKLLETGALVISILIVSFALQDGSSHYLKGFVLLLAYVVIGACFFVLGTPSAFGMALQRKSSECSFVPFDRSFKEKEAQTLDHNQCRSGGGALQLVDAFCLLVFVLQIRWRVVAACGLNCLLLCTALRRRPRVGGCLGVCKAFPPAKKGSHGRCRVTPRPQFQSPLAKKSCHGVFVHRFKM